MMEKSIAAIIHCSCYQWSFYIAVYIEEPPVGIILTAV